VPSGGQRADDILAVLTVSDDDRHSHPVDTRPVTEMINSPRSHDGNQ
jgi:hypothetical protein